MGPLLFEPFAKLLAERCARLHPERILETAAGTGIVTRAVHRAVPQAHIVATDVNTAMLDFAAQSLRSEQVSFQPANAQDLPFDESSFDLVLCQFGIMFFPDKLHANVQARRVLRPHGQYLLVIFNRLEMNPIPKAAQDAINKLFPQSPIDYMERGPFSYADRGGIKRDLLAAGFDDVEIETIELSSRVNPNDAAQALVFGSPLRAEIERRDPSTLEHAANTVARALVRWEGRNAPISAHVVTARPFVAN